MHVGILTGGGDCPGLNAVIRAVTLALVNECGARVTGIERGFLGLLTRQMRPLDAHAVEGLLAQGGTVLGTHNRCDPFRYFGAGGADVSDQALATVREAGIEALVALGGDGTMAIAQRFADRGLPVVGVPKTIDNDLFHTDRSFGFDSAVAVVAEALDRLETTARSHGRVMIAETMGRYAGWIALEGGIAGGADAILIPELPVDVEAVAAFCRERESVHGYTLICVAEGAKLGEGGLTVRETLADSPDPLRLGGVAQVLQQRLAPVLGSEVRHTLLGHVQRGGSLLTKAYRPLPTKTSFKDVESRYRMRYVDLVANREVTNVFRARTFIISALRRFFDERGFLEVETPTMHSIIGGAAAKPFSTHHNALDMNLFMRIAPELYLKRLVVGGFERVYEIARCYRNEGLSTRHNPEFSMLEYYQAYATYETLMDQTEAMLRAVDQALAATMPEEHKVWSSARSWTFERFVRVSMADAIKHALERSGLPAEVATTVDADDAPIKIWAKAAKEKKREIDWANFRSGMKKCDSAGERVFCAYEYLAEPYLTADYRSEDGSKSLPVFIIDYPFEVSPLARKKDADGTLVDRFELFVDGRELCNAFSELNDPEDQDARFRAQVEKKARGAEETMDYDADYVRALEFGMPPTAGFGMGVDRLAMLLTGSASIRDVILFPLLRPEASEH